MNKPITSQNQCEALNEYLNTRSYLHEYTPSSVDLLLLNLIKVEPATRLNNLNRWLKHIRSFSVDERKLFRKIDETDLTKLSINIPPADSKDADDDFDLFGSDDNDEDSAENEKILKERIAVYEAKKAVKPKASAKSSVIFDVKPWESDTDLKELENKVRSINMDGLTWGASKLVPIAFGIKKLQISSVIEDEKVSTDELEELMTAFEDHVQSVDVVSFNKL